MFSQQRNDPILAAVRLTQSRDCFLRFQFNGLRTKPVNERAFSLTTTAGSTVYFSSPTIIEFFHSQTVVLIDRNYAQLLGIEEKQNVLIRPVSSSSFASRLCVAPLSTSDWDLLTSLSSQIESSLLSQLQLTFIGQKFQIWLNSGELCLSFECIDVTPKQESTLWLDDQTQLEIIPKITHNPSSPSSSSSSLSPLKSAFLHQFQKYFFTTHENQLKAGVPNSAASNSRPATATAATKFCELLRIFLLKNDEKKFPFQNVAFILNSICSSHGTAADTTDHNNDDKAADDDQCLKYFFGKIEFQNQMERNRKILIRQMTKLELCKLLMMMTSSAEEKIKEDDAMMMSLYWNCLMEQSCFVYDESSINDKQRQRQSPPKQQQQQQQQQQSGFHLGEKVLLRRIQEVPVEIHYIRWKVNEKEMNGSELRDVVESMVRRNEEMKMPLMVENGRAMRVPWRGKSAVVVPGFRGEFALLETRRFEMISFEVVFEASLKDGAVNAGQEEEDAGHLSSLHDDAMQKIWDAVEMIVVSPPESSFCRGVLVTGVTGAGKTTLLAKMRHLLPDQFGLPVAWVDCRRHKGRRVDKLKALLEEQLLWAQQRDPAVIVLEDLDELLVSGTDTPEVDSEAALYAQRIAEVLQTIVRRMYMMRLRTVLLASAAEELPFDGHQLFVCVVELPLPDQETRLQLLNAHLKPGTDATTLAARTERSTPRSLQSLCDRTNALMMIGHATDAAPEEKKRGLSEIGGLDEIKRSLIETFMWPLQHPALLASCPLPLPRGALLYGPPGCGKTSVALALAGEAGIPLICVSGPELLSKFVGESERKVRDAFRRAHESRPCILFFDEFEALVPRRGLDRSGVGDRVVNQFLTEMDGLERQEGVFLLAASSRPDLIDPAVLRPGRIDKRLYCGLPDASERAAILSLLGRSCRLSGDVDLEVVARRTEGLSGADVKALLFDAQLLAFDESRGEESGRPVVGQRHLDRAVGELTPSLSTTERRFFEEIHGRFTRDDPLPDPGRLQTTG